MYYIPQYSGKTILNKRSEAMQQKLTKLRITLFPRRICETLSGDLAYTVGRLIFRPGRPMLVEHLGHIYLEHDLSGGVITPGYDAGYTVVHILRDEEAVNVREILCRS
jgi:hypothetical protein